MSVPGPGLESGVASPVNFTHTMRADWQIVMGFLSQAGLEVFTRDSTTDLNTPEGIEAFEVMYALIYEDNVATLTNGSLVDGTAAMQYGQTSIMSHAMGLGTLPPDAVGVALPVKGYRQSNQVHINKAGISSLSKNPDLAWKWIEFVLEPENAARIAAATMQFPSRISPSRMEPFTLDPRWETWYGVAMRASTIPGWHPDWLDFQRQVLNKTLREILGNEVPIRTSLEEAERLTLARYGGGQ